MNKPLVSVVIPIYNGGIFLEQTINSILNQTYFHLELILVNDASTDDTTLKILSMFKDKDQRIKIVHHQKNQGVAQTRNHGLQVANGKYYAVMDQDDISLPGRIEDEVNYLEQHPDVFAVGGQVDTINQCSALVGQRSYPVSDSDIRKMLPIRSPFCNPTMLIRSSLMKELNYYDTQFSNSEEYDLWFKITQSGKVANLPNKVLQYRIGPFQTSRKQIRNVLWNTIQIKKKWIFSPPFFSMRAVFIYLSQLLLFCFPDFVINWIFERFYHEKV